jgi:hypothetical protein
MVTYTVCVLSGCIGLPFLAEILAPPFALQKSPLAALRYRVKYGLDALLARGRHDVRVIHQNAIVPTMAIAIRIQS